MDLIKNSFRESQQVLDAFVSDEDNLEKVRMAGDLLVEMYRGGGKVFSCGNGGSLCDAMHFAEELTGRFRKDRPALAALPIADASHLTCTANDMGYERAFARFIEALGKPEDVLLAISTSGNSPNVLAAIEEAKGKGMRVIGLTGKMGGKMKEVCDVAIVVPWNAYSDRVQEIHIKIIHILIEYIERHLFGI